MRPTRRGPTSPDLVTTPEASTATLSCAIRISQPAPEKRSREFRRWMRLRPIADTELPAEAAPLLEVMSEATLERPPTIYLTPIAELLLPES